MSAKSQRSGLTSVPSQVVAARPDSHTREHRYDCLHPAVRAAARRAGLDVHAYVQLRTVELSWPDAAGA